MRNCDILKGKIKFLLNVYLFGVKVCPMNQNKISSRVYNLIKSALAAAVLPVLFIYIMISKPDYAIMNAAAHIVVPVAQWVGNIVTWPVRALGDAVDGVTEISSIRAENKELRARLDALLAEQNKCKFAIAENTLLNRQLNTVQQQPFDIVVADVVHDTSAIGHNTYFINRGTYDGIKNGMVVTSPDMTLAGIVIDCGQNFARVRALTDADTNIAVRVVGSEVYGFLDGNGSANPTIGFFSNPEFQPSNGIQLVTSSISGVLPAGLHVGEITDKNDVRVLSPKKLSRVFVLKFNTNQNEYRK